MSTIPALANLLKPRDIKAETPFDTILKAFLGGKIEQLPDDQQKMLERWRLVHRLITDGKIVKKGKNDITQPYTFTMLADFLVAEYKVSYRTAYDDIANAKRFFLSTYSKDDKDFARGVMIDWGEKLMFEAAGTGDFKSAAAFFKALSEIKSLLKDDQEVPDYANINIPSFILVADPSELGFPKIDDPQAAVNRILAKRKKDKIDIIISESEPIEFTEHGRKEDLAQ
jgi:hypothetical protein